MPDPYGFDGATLRHARAREHLTYIKKQLRIFREGNPYPILPYEDTDALPQDRLELAARFDDLLRPSGFELTRDVRLSPKLGVRVGEMIYNLRTALDYLVYSLAWHDSGTRPTGKHERQLQFPIEDGCESFKGRRPTLLKGVTDEHAALVESYQPYKGCDWTGTLRDLSNIDKHRHIAVLAGSFNTYNLEYFTSLSEIPEAQRERARLASPGQVDVGLYATLDVTFEDGLPVGQVLQELETQVGQLLSRFRPEFRYLPLD